MPPDLDPPELGNEDEVFLSLLDRAAGRSCLCSHPELDHWETTGGGTSCMHRACGCQRFRPEAAP